MGYQTNKIISKQGSDIIVCFFPIDRFLSKGFKKLFLDEPALFFSPYEMLVDHKVDLTKILPDNFFSASMVEEMRSALGCYLFNSKILSENSNETTPPPSESLNEATLSDYCRGKGKPKGEVVAALETLEKVSLNTICAVVDGVMSVDTTTLPAKIENVTINGEKAGNTWTVASGATNTITGTINGAYLTGATPVIQEAKADQIAKIEAVTDGSTDQALKVSFVLGKSLQSGDHLTFMAEKTTKDSKAAPVESAPFM